MSKKSEHEELDLGVKEAVGKAVYGLAYPFVESLGHVGINVHVSAHAIIALEEVLNYYGDRNNNLKDNEQHRPLTKAILNMYLLSRSEIGRRAKTMEKISTEGVKRESKKFGLPSFFGNRENDYD